jgi:hypothetical protein
MNDDRKDLIVMLASQCASVQQSLFLAVVGRGGVSDGTLKDVRRILDHLVRAIDERDNA